MLNMHRIALKVEDELLRAEREGHASLKMSGRFQAGLAAIRAAEPEGLRIKVLGCKGGDWMVRVGEGLLAIDLVLGRAKVCVGNGWGAWL